MPQNRPNARVQDPNRPILAPRAPLHGPDVPPATRVVAETWDAFLTLARVVLRHSTTLQQMGGDAGPSGHDAGPSSSLGPSSSSRPSSSAGPSTGAPPPTDAGPSTSAPPSTHPQQSSDPHECTSCGRPCYGLSTDVAFSGFSSELLRFDARDPPDFGLGHGIAATDPFVGGGIHDGTDPSGSTEILDPSLGGEIHETHHGTQAPTQTSGPLPADASPPRPSVDKGRVYMRRSTPKKTRAAHGHGVTEPMEPELTEESLASMVDAAVDAASSMAASHTEAPVAGVVLDPPVSTTVEAPTTGAVFAPLGSTTVETMPPIEEVALGPPGLTIIDVEPTAPSATQGAELQLSLDVVEDPSTHIDSRDEPSGSKSGKNKRKLDF